jgi:hypothetical protein
LVDIQKNNLTTEDMTTRDGGNAENGWSNFLPEFTEREKQRNVGLENYL